jgi:phage terminase small subunit
MRAVIAVLALGLATGPALAANPKIEAAVKTFKAVAADPAKLRTYCAMSKVMERMGEKEDKAAEAEIDRYLAQLGPDFQTAWDAAEGVDENSADGKLYYAAMDDLEQKCPK